MPRYIDRPTRFTVNGIRFQSARRSEPIREQKSAVFIQETQSAYLNPLIRGETLTELYGRSPIISPVTGNLSRRGYRLGIRLNRSGNVPGLNRGKIQRVIDDPRTFEVDLPGTSDLSPGIYIRTRSGIDKLFSYSRDTRREAIFPFPELALRVYDRDFPGLYRDALRECLA